ncbi:hypothetical protein F5Y19DRAFT_490232 [Xylariaceae sp. FL1651]|nr:hypothetical protein F5Y19DRAFT_490232 [Xylariaceae sp. FL1651]
MADTHLSYDALLQVSQFFDEKELLNLGATNKSLHQSLTWRALKEALFEKPIDYDRKPMTYAIMNGNIQLLSQIHNFLDSFYPDGWKWSRFYTTGVERILQSAATQSITSLQYLAQRYPLRPGSQEYQTTSALHHGFYAANGHPYVAEFADMQNRALVRSAILAERFDCAAFLLKQHQPPLFPNGFKTGRDTVFYNSASTLEFLIKHGACLGEDALHIVAAGCSRCEPLVFDVLVKNGFGVDSPNPCLIDVSNSQIETPIHTASHHLNPTAVEALLRLGANPNGIGHFWLEQNHFNGSFRYRSPNLFLTLLFSPEWDVASWVPGRTSDAIGQKLILCFKSLLQYGAKTSIPLLNCDVFEVLLLNLWRVVGIQALDELRYTLPRFSNNPQDGNQEVQSLLQALEQIEVHPWDELCDVVVDATPEWKKRAMGTSGKQRLLKLFRTYQEQHRDLPTPSQLLQYPSVITLPDRYVVELNDDHHA